MKKTVLILALSLLTLLIISCSKDDNQPSNKENGFTYSIKALSNNFPVSGAKVIAITSNDSEIMVNCDNNGNALIKTLSPIKIICCVSLGKSKAINVSNNNNFIIKMDDLKKPNLQNTKSTGTFGVYSTDGNGDVSFKYTGIFQGYYCTSWLPYLGSQNPNSWDGWNLTNWLPTWKGKKLLVPRRYQIYHQTAYGCSISSALFLMSLY
ncbi:MAG: hypothetical protein WCJ57_01850 [Candidatus Falkowbacteria bacterium]